jgi:hypothetical protein
MTIPNPVIARRNDEAICYSTKRLLHYKHVHNHKQIASFLAMTNYQAVMLNSVQHLLAQHSQAHQEILNYEIIMNTIDKHSLSE